MNQIKTNNRQNSTGKLVLVENEFGNLRPFLQVPDFLLSDPRYRKLSDGAKLLYGGMLSRLRSQMPAVLAFFHDFGFYQNAGIFSTLVDDRDFRPAFGVAMRFSNLPTRLFPGFIHTADLSGKEPDYE